MRLAPFLAFQLMLACGGRTLVDRDELPPVGTEASGGTASGGFPSGTSGGAAAATGGVAAATGGSGACLEITQRDANACIHVRLCPGVQHQTLCVPTSPSTASCFCYIDGEPTSATSDIEATNQTLCDAAERLICPS